MVNFSKPRIVNQPIKSQTPIQVHLEPVNVKSVLKEFIFNCNAKNVLMCNFIVPSDLKLVESIIVSGTTNAIGGNKDIDIFVEYHGIGENSNHNIESDVTSKYELKSNVSINITGLFSKIAANDKVNLLIKCNDIGGTLEFREVKVRYT